jgi:uncharacterized membrane protein YgcG
MGDRAGAREQPGLARRHVHLGLHWLPFGVRKRCPKLALDARHRDASTAIAHGSPSRPYNSASEGPMTAARAAFGSSAGKANFARSARSRGTPPYGPLRKSCSSSATELAQTRRNQRASAPQCAHDIAPELDLPGAARGLLMGLVATALGDVIFLEPAPNLEPFPRSDVCARDALRAQTKSGQTFCSLHRSRHTANRTITLPMSSKGRGQGQLTRELVMVSTRVFGRVLFAVLSFGVVGGSLPSCGSSSSKSTPTTKGCTVNSDCDSPLVCGLQRCHSACRETRDCPDSERCIFTSDGEICQLPDEAKCHYNSDCKDPKLVCAIDGVCRSQCQADIDCPAEQECLKPDLVCVAPAELNSDGKLTPVDGGVSSEGGAGNSTGNGGSGESEGGKSGGGGTSAGGGTNAGAAGEAGSGPGPKCPFGLGDCDSNPNDCETDLTLITSCGACDVVCHATHGPVQCDAATLKCVVNTVIGCDSGYADCNHDGQDGCESIPAKDPNNCGTCGHTCGGGTCTAGQCSPPIFLDPSNAPTSGVTYNQSGDTFLIGSSLGKLNIDNGTELRIATLPTSAATVGGTILVSSASPIYSAVADSTTVYYSIGGSPSSVLYKPLTGSTTTPAKVAATLPSSNLPYTMTPVGTSLYIYAGNAIYVAQQGSTATTLIPGLSGLYPLYSPMVIVGGNLFWVGLNMSSYDVYTAPLGGGTPVAIAHVHDNGPILDNTLTADGKYAYWISSLGAGSKVQRVVAKGTPTAANVEDIAVGINAPDQPHVLVDTNYVYYLQGFQVFRVKNDGSASPEPLALANAAPNIYNLFAVDSTYVYGTGSGGQIVGVAKDALGL